MHAEKMMADILPKAYEWAFELFVAAEPYTLDRPEWCGLFYRAFVICVKRYSQVQVCPCSWASVACSCIIGHRDALHAVRRDHLAQDGQPRFIDLAANSRQLCRRHNKGVRVGLLLFSLFYRCLSCAFAACCIYVKLSCSHAALHAAECASMWCSTASI